MRLEERDFEPRVLAFLCNWCGYAGADLAGVSRIQYATNVRTIRVMCSGRVDPVFIIEALLRHMDGVLVIGCHPGECHYMFGNYEALKTMQLTKIILENAGMKSDRLQFEYVSASEGARFAQVVNSFTATITRLGPVETNADTSVVLKLRAAKKALDREGIRWIVGKQTEFLEKGNKYGEVFTHHEMNRLLDKTVREAMNENEILLILEEEGPLSIKGISERINRPSPEVLKYAHLLKKRGQVAVSGAKGGRPLYAAQTNSPVEC